MLSLYSLHKVTSEALKKLSGVYSRKTPVLNENWTWSLPYARTHRTQEEQATEQRDVVPEEEQRDIANHFWREIFLQNDDETFIAALTMMVE